MKTNKKKTKNVVEFHEFILQQAKTQNDMKAWKRYYFQENGNRELWP